MSHAILKSLGIGAEHSGTYLGQGEWSKTTDAGVLHRVRMGPFTQVEAMNKVRAKLSENGIDVAVVRNQK